MKMSRCPNVKMQASLRDGRGSPGQGGGREEVGIAFSLISCLCLLEYSRVWSFVFVSQGTAPARLCHMLTAYLFILDSVAEMLLQKVDQVPCAEHQILLEDTDFCVCVEGR